MKKILALACTVLACTVGAQHETNQKMSHIMIKADAIKWGPAPPGLPPGAKMAVVYGNPSKEGYFTLRAKLPPGYTIRPHWHPTDEHITLLSGTMHMGGGPKFDRAKSRAMNVGDYAVAVAKEAHYVFTGKSEAVIQVSAMGPFEITYINPADDPRKGGVAK